MANSDSLSKGDSNSAPPRKRFHLAGPSVPVDPRVHAVRRDLADIALADRVFAQHYVVPMVHKLVHAADVHLSPRGDAEVIATLDAGAAFHVLDIGRDWAWGCGDVQASVGYVAATALAPE